MTDSAERRHETRHLACFPAYLERTGPDGEKETSIIADLCVGGALLLVRKPTVKVGDALRLELFISLDAHEFRAATGKVMRVEALPEARVSLWTHQAAVKFDEPLTLYEAEITAMMERQAKLGLKR